MSIEIKHNDAPKLRKPRFTVDTELHNKLNEYEITKLMNRHNFTLYLGKAGSGKSTLLISMLNTPSLFKGVYHTIILFVRPIREPVSKTIFGVSYQKNKYMTS